MKVSKLGRHHWASVSWMFQSVSSSGLEDEDARELRRDGGSVWVIGYV